MLPGISIWISQWTNPKDGASTHEEIGTQDEIENRDGEIETLLASQANISLMLEYLYDYNHEGYKDACESHSATLSPEQSPELPVSVEISRE